MINKHPKSTSGFPVALHTSKDMAPLALLLFSVLLAALLLVFLGKASRSHRRRSQLPLPPGPRGLPVVGNLLQLGTKPHVALRDLSHVYGPLMHLRLGSAHVVVASSADAAAACLKANDANFASRPFNAGAKHMAYGDHDLVWAPYGPRWRMLRRVCTHHLVSPKAVEDFREVRQQEVARVVAYLSSQGAGPAGQRKEEDPPVVPIGDWLSMCAANALTRAMMGRRLFVSESELVGDKRTYAEETELRMAKEFQGMTAELMQLGGEFVIGDYVPALAWFDPKGTVAKMKSLHKRFDHFLDGILQEHKASNDTGGHKDMVSILMGLKEDADGEGAKLSDTEIKALLLNLFIGGTDTTFDSVEWALAELVRHPDLQRRAQLELDAVVGRDRLVTEADLSDLPFLNAVVKEALRLHPPAPLALPHLASEDCQVNGYHVPKGATLIVNLWAISRDPTTWQDPLDFRPERFLPGGEAGHVDVRGNHFEVIPFGAGRRICVGINWGLRMVLLMAATLVHAFLWDPPPGQKPQDLSMEEAYALALHRAEPLLVRPSRRLEPAAYAIAAQ